MENISTPFILGKQIHDFCSEHESSKLFTLPFSEHDVLQLQEMFVKPGLHLIKVKDVTDGRKIIQTILSSLNYYHNIGCITNVAELSPTVCNIINHIKLHKPNSDNLLLELEDFFTVHACFDFIWIELTQGMKKQYSLKDIQKVFNMYHVDERMPVLIMMYEK